MERSAMEIPPSQKSFNRPEMSYSIILQSAIMNCDLQKVT